MRERVAGLVGPEARRMWVFTFRSACVQIARTVRGRGAAVDVHDL